MQKIFKIVLILLGVLGVALWFMLPGEEVPVDTAMEDTNVNFMFYIAYVLLLIPIVAVLLYTFRNLFKSPDKLKKALISIVGFLVVVVISYALSSGGDVDLDDFAQKGIEVTESSSKMVGAGLITFYILAAIAILYMAVSSLKKVFSK